MHPIAISRLASSFMLLGSFACAGQAAPALADFGAATFIGGAPIDHPYFPLLDGHTRVYTGIGESEGEAILEQFELTVVGAGPTLFGVATTARRDRAFEEGLLVEETYDYYAQDSVGNVWYFGEDVVNYIYDEEDNLIETNNESAWHAGENSALPGLIMPSDLHQGFHYYQEFAPFDAALDEGTTLASDRTLSIALGEFDDVLAVLETSLLSPQSREIKYYAPGLGLIAADEGLDLHLRNPSMQFELTAITAVPLPTSVMLMASALAGLGTIRRRHAV